MIYLDNGATSFHKPPAVYRAVLDTMRSCANPGRGGYGAAVLASRKIYGCREEAAKLFDCQPQQVILTSGCTHGLNIAIRSLVQSGSRVLISGFEHNAVTRVLHALKAKVTVAGRKLFDWDNILTEWEQALKQGQDAAVFTHVSNVFIFLICLAEGAEVGGVFSLISAFCFLFSGTAPGFYCVPFITVLAVLMTIFRQALLRDGFFSAALCTAAALLVYELLVFAVGLFLELTLFDRITGFLITTALTLIAIPILYPMIHSISTIGGNTWKD